MADPRLQWRQLSQAQPNTSGFIREMRGGINDAVSAAEGMLGRYQEGQEVAGDQELARLLASATNQDELDALVNSDQVKGLNLSKDGIGMLNAAQGRRVDWANTRSVINDRKGRLGVAQGHLGVAQGRLGIAQDANTRAGEQFGWTRDNHNRGQAQQAWLQKNAGAYLNSERNALTGGTAFSKHIDHYESGGGNDQYDTLYGHRNRKNGVRVSQMTIGEAGQFASPSGKYGQSVNAEIGRVATPMGKFQIVGTTLRGLQKDLGLPNDVPFSPQVQEQLGLLLAQRRIEGRSQQAARDGLRAEWEGFKNVSNAELDAMIGEIRQMPAVTRDSVLGAAAKGSPATFQRPTGQTIKTGFGGDDFAADMAASGQFTPQEILSQVDPLRSAADQGDKLAAAELAQEQEDIIAALINNATDNADNLATSDVIDDVVKAAKESGRFDESELFALQNKVANEIGGSDYLKGKLNPSISQDLETTGMIDRTIEQAEQELYTTQTNRVLKEIPNYTEDPTGSLEAALGIPNDSETRGDYDPEKLRHLINRLATAHNVEPAVMAVAMREAFVRDPGDDGQHWWDVDWTRNTMERRFNQDIIGKTIQQITPASRALFNEGKTNIKIMEQQMQQVAAQRTRLRKTLAKLPADSPRRSAIEAQLVALDTQFAAIKSNRGNHP